MELDLYNASPSQSGGSSSLVTCGRKLSYPPEIDEKLVQLVKSEQNAGMVISPDMLRREALRLIQPYCYDFKASTGWLDKFLTRHKLVLQPAARINGGGISKESDDTVVNTPPPKLLSVSEMDLSSPSAANNSVSQHDDDLDDDDDDDENESGKKDDATPQKPVNTERLKAFNMFVRLFIDENLDRLVPISKQPKEKINAIIMSCQRQFPEFSDRARKRIRTYLKSCRRSTRLREPSSKPSMTHIPASQLTEVNNILARACENETQEVAKRQRLESGESVPTSFHHRPMKIHPIEQKTRSYSNKVVELQTAALSNSGAPQKGASILPSFIPTSLKAPLLKLTQSEVNSVRSLIEGYRQSASFLHRSADELERLLKNCEAFSEDAVPLESKKKNNTEPVLDVTEEYSKPKNSIVDVPSSKIFTMTDNASSHASSTRKDAGNEHPSLKVHMVDVANTHFKDDMLSISSVPINGEVKVIPVEGHSLKSQLNAISQENAGTEKSEKEVECEMTEVLSKEASTVKEIPTRNVSKEDTVFGTDHVSATKSTKEDNRQLVGRQGQSAVVGKVSSSDTANSDLQPAPELLPLIGNVPSNSSFRGPERILSPTNRQRSPMRAGGQQYQTMSPDSNLSPEPHHGKQVANSPQQMHPLHVSVHSSPQTQLTGHVTNTATQHSSTYSQQQGRILTHSNLNHSQNVNLTANRLSSPQGMNQQLYSMRQNQPQHQPQTQVQHHQNRHVNHQQRQSHSLSSGHHQPSHHQTVFNFDTSPTQQQVVDMRQQHMHQRLSPHPLNYHGLLSPVGSPHLHDMRQSHMQDLSRQPHLQDLGRQVHLQEMTRQSLSDYQHAHNMVFDSHPSH